MKIFNYISILILFSCSYSATTSGVEDVVSTPENLNLYLKDNDRFDIYYKSDTLSFHLKINNAEDNEYTYDIYSIKDKVKSGRFVYGVNFEDSDTLNLYFDSTSLSLPKDVCNKWINFVKESKLNFYYKNLQ
jgi:hypothetical protein